MSRVNTGRISLITSWFFLDGFGSIFSRRRPVRGVDDAPWSAGFSVAGVSPPACIGTCSGMTIIMGGGSPGWLKNTVPPLLTAIGPVAVE